jgi:DNA-binding PadR family transcriptional regulator
VLAAFSAEPSAWRHGYDLCKSTGLPSGTLYPLLIRLHEQGFLAAEWRPAGTRGRPPRHAYRLTPAGMALAASTETRLASQGPLGASVLATS